MLASEGQLSLKILLASHLVQKSPSRFAQGKRK
jgi:hypothetical protein